VRGEMAAATAATPVWTAVRSKSTTTARSAAWPTKQLRLLFLLFDVDTILTVEMERLKNTIRSAVKCSNISVHKNCN